MPKLVIILGDQLTTKLSALAEFKKDEDEILMMEVWDESSYVKHHKKKLVFILSAMRHFAKSLTGEGFKVNYIKLDSQESLKSFTETLLGFIKTRHSLNQAFHKIISTEASEYRVLDMQKSWTELL